MTAITLHTLPLCVPCPMLRSHEGDKGPDASIGGDVKKTVGLAFFALCAV